MASYNDYTIQIPEEWQDRTTARWIAPTRYESTPTLKKQKLPRENFVIERQPIPEDVTDPLDYLHGRLDTLEQLLEAFEVVDEVSAWDKEDFKGAQSSYTFVMEQLPVRQCHHVLFAGDTVFHLIGTATISGYAEAQTSFQKLLDSFQPTPK